METKRIEIVKLPPSEWRAYRTLRLEALQESPRAFGSSYAESVQRPDEHWQQRLEEASGKGNWLLFAREGERLVGVIGAFIEKDEPQTAHIIHVYVAPEARGRGISTLLMEAILAEIKQAAVKKARLGVNVLQTPALNLYKRFGFQVVGKEEHLLMGDGAYHDEYWMEKDLSTTLPAYWPNGYN